VCVKEWLIKDNMYSYRVHMEDMRFQFVARVVGHSHKPFLHSPQNTLVDALGGLLEPGEAIQVKNGRRSTLRKDNVAVSRNFLVFVGLSEYLVQKEPSFEI
jgi:hypothetical protein